MPERDAFGLRIGSKRAKAAALYARKEGATLDEVRAELGAIHFNVLTQLKEKGFSYSTKKEAGDKNRNVTRYYLHLKEH